jgi:hypothetical protein
MRPDLGAPDADQTDRKLTQPLGTAVEFILVLAASLLVVVLVLAVWSGHVSMFGFGSGSACSDVPLNGITITGNSGPALAHLRPGATSGGRLLELCASHPTTGQRGLVTLAQAPTVLLYLAVVLLLGQLLRAIRRAGPFALLVARRLRFLGWFVLAGSLLVTVGESVAQSAFASTLVTDSVPAGINAVNAVIAGIFVPALIACGLLTLARVIRVGAQMSDDLAGTV